MVFILKRILFVVEEGLMKKPASRIPPADADDIWNFRESTTKPCVTKVGGIPAVCILNIVDRYHWSLMRRSCLSYVNSYSGYVARLCQNNPSWFEVIPKEVMVRVICFFFTDTD